MVEIEALLRSGTVIQIKPQGFSMYPLFYPGRDEVIIAPIENRKLKRGEVAVFRRKGSILVIHRICKVTKEGYYFVGDNQKEIEGPIEQKQLLGVMIGFIRKGKEYSVDHIGYRACSFLWLMLRPVRPVLSKIVAKLKRLRKIGRKKMKEK